jgi:hypothetical protein
MDNCLQRINRAFLLSVFPGTVNAFDRIRTEPGKFPVPHTFVQ